MFVSSNRGQREFNLAAEIIGEVFYAPKVRSPGLSLCFSGLRRNRD